MHGLKSTTAFSIILLLVFITSTCTDSATGPEENKEEPPSDEPYSQVTQPGHSANDFLADSNFTALTVEVDYMGNYEPTQQALDSLKAFLEKRLNKSEITINEPTSIPNGGQSSYTANEVRDFEEEHRDLFTQNGNDNTLTAYMIVLDGEYDSGSVLGIAYYNTSVAFFGETISRVSSGVTSPSRKKVEGTVFQHEFGHLFGLVNIEGSGTEMQTPHQDEEHGRHCDNSECLMYWAVETTDFFANIFEGNIPDLDQNCVLDLQANGGK